MKVITVNIRYVILYIFIVDKPGAICDVIFTYLIIIRMYCSVVVFMTDL